MTPEQDDLLCKTFPLLYADRNTSMQETCMCWGFCCGSGWFQLIWGLSEKLEAIIEKLPANRCVCGCDTSMHLEHGCQGVFTFKGKSTECGCSRFCPDRPRASQLKEKFGMMRMYITTGTEEMYSLISEAEEKSGKICETCGADGEIISDHGWLKTRCEAHVEDR